MFMEIAYKTTKSGIRTTSYFSFSTADTWRLGPFEVVRRTARTMPLGDATFPIRVSWTARVNLGPLGWLSWWTKGDL